MHDTSSEVVVKRSLFAAVEERWLVPAYSSPHASAWIAAHGCLTLPFRLRGETRRYAWTADGRELTLVTIGSPERLRQFCTRLTGRLSLQGAESRVTTWRPGSLDAAIAEPSEQVGRDADLAVVQIHRWAAARFRRAGWYIMPDAVRWQANVADVPPAQLSKSLRDDLRKIRQHRYELQEARSPADWDEFYETMVVPQAERFGDEAWIPSAAFLGALRKIGVLHFIVRGGVRVGGFCVVPSGDRVWYPVLGTLAGDESLRRDGVVAAVYSLGVDWAKRNGYRSIDKGRTSSFVNDGIAAYKRKWGLKPVSDPMCPRFALKLGPDPAVAAAFARQPVCIETETGLDVFAGGLDD